MIGKKDKNLNITKFRISFNNQYIEINLDSSFEEYKTLTIGSIIQDVLDKIGSKLNKKTSKDYILICSCGKSFNNRSLISESKCQHYFDSDYKKSKNEDEFFILKEKENIENFEKYFSKKQIGRNLMKTTGGKHIKKLYDLIPEKAKDKILMSENFKKKIRELITKKERGSKILEKDMEIKYNEEIFNQLLELGIDENKIRAALRITNNNKEEAILLATNQKFDWTDKNYLFYKNNEVLTNYEFRHLCREEFLREFPEQESSEDIDNDIKKIINLINNEKKGLIISNQNNDSNEEYESSEEDSMHDTDSSNSIIF